MKLVNLRATNQFDDKGMRRALLHDSPYMRLLNFNLKAGQTFPVHSHPAEGQVVIHVIEGMGEFLGADDTAIPAGAGDMLVCDIREPHGVHAISDLRIVVMIAPPF